LNNKRGRIVANTATTPIVVARWLCESMGSSGELSPPPTVVVVIAMTWGGTIVRTLNVNWFAADVLSSSSPIFVVNVSGVTFVRSLLTVVTLVLATMSAVSRIT